MLAVKDQILGENQNVVQIDNYVLVKDVSKNVIHKMLEDGQTIT